jgi:hypothetical protein
MESENEFYLLAVVALVAIVGIVVLIMGANKAPVAMYTSSAASEDVTGQAYLSCVDCMDNFVGGPRYPDAFELCQRRGACASGAGSSGN